MQQHVPGSLPAATGTRGDTPTGPALHRGQPQRVDACTIRRSANVFNRKLPLDGAGFDIAVGARADFRSNSSTGGISECPAVGVWGIPVLHTEFPEEIDAPFRCSFSGPANGYRE